MRNVITIAHFTLAEARRRRIVLTGLVCALVFLIVFAIAAVFTHRELIANPSVAFIERQGAITMMMLVGFFAANFLSVMFAILLPVDTLSGEIDSGVMQTLASKPVDRWEIVIGKWLGHLLLAAGYLLLLSAIILITTRTLGGSIPPDLWRALPLLLLEITLSLTITLAGGARFSTVTNAVVAVGIYGLSFIGGLVEYVGSVGDIRALRTVGITVSLLSPADSMWRLAGHYLQPAIMRGSDALSLGKSVPTGWMVWWAAGYTCLALLYAVRAFRRRAL